MSHITNNQVREFVNRRAPFTTTNKTIYAEHRDNLYVVYSYGAHFPMYIYDGNAAMWFGNEDKYSRTTTNHQTKARPNAEIDWCSTDYMRAMVIAGGYASQCADRICGHETIN